MKKVSKRDVIDTFFGKRNNIEFTQKENINFTDETLEYMMPKMRADELVKSISTFFDNEPMVVVDFCSGIGGTVLSFLDNPHVAKVLCYEINKDRRNMLLNNINAYEFNKKRFEVEDNNNGFEGLSIDAISAYKGKNLKLALHIDPPWLKPGQNYYVDKEFITEDIRLGEYSLEEWVDKCRYFDLITIRVPKGYVLNSIEDTEVEEEETKNAKIYFIINTRKLKDNKIINLSFKENSDNNGDIVNLSSYTKYNKIPDSDYYYNNRYMKNNREWSKGLRDFLRVEILNQAGLSGEKLDIITDEESMKMWEIVFTDSTFHPTQDENYESIETVGDAVMEVAFLKWIRKQNLGFSPEFLNNLSSKILSTGYQANVSKEYGLHKWLRSRIELDINIGEDLLEALFGGMFEIGNSKLKNIGMIIADNFINIIFERFPLNLDCDILGPPITDLKEIYEGLGWINDTTNSNAIDEKYRYIVNPNGNEIRVNVILNSKAIEFIFNEKGIQLEKTLATAKGKTKHQTKTKASIIALEELAKIGIDKNFKNEWKEKKNANNPEYKLIFDKVMKYVKGIGYEGLTFGKPKQVTGNTEKIGNIIIIGVKKDGHKDTLYVEPNCPIKDGNKIAIENYARSLNLF